MKVLDRNDTYVGEVSYNGDVHDRNGYVGRVDADSEIHSSTYYEGHVYSTGKIRDRSVDYAGCPV